MRNKGFLRSCMASKLATAAVAAGLSLCSIARAEAAGHGYKIIYNFQGEADGALPSSTLTIDANNNLYGTTAYGGNLNDCAYNGFGCGVIFKIDATGTESALHAFSGPDGAQPYWQLLLDGSGNLYGTTSFGGSGGTNCPYVNAKCGTVFKLAPDGTETVLYSFTGGTDGSAPGLYEAAGNGALVMDASGNLYGTTSYGGDLSCNDGQGCGVIYKVSPSGTETVLHTFESTDGAFPTAGMLADGSGNLYGTTVLGGTSNFGTVFELSNAGNESVLYNFTNGNDGTGPVGNLIQDEQGNFYGTALNGGQDGNGKGVVFKLSSTGDESTVYSFYGDQDGGNPYSGLIRDASGNLYGTTCCGGIEGDGVVFRVNKKGKESTLHSFRGGHRDGSSPHFGLVLGQNGVLYGATQYGGSGHYGTVFEITP